MRPTIPTINKKHDEPIGGGVRGQKPTPSLQQKQQLCTRKNPENQFEQDTKFKSIHKKEKKKYSR